MTIGRKSYDNLAVYLCIKDNMAMKQEYEIISYPKICHTKVFIDRIKYRTQHLHGDYEFCLLLEGECTFHTLTESIDLAKGEIVFIDSNNAHSIDGNGKEVVGLFIQVSNRFLSDYLPELSSRIYEAQNLKNVLNSVDLQCLCEKICRVSTSYFASEEGYRLLVISLLVKLMGLVTTRIPSKELSQKDKDNRKRNAERLERIVNYIDENHSDRISLQSIAAAEGISTTHLSHLFVKGLGVNFQDYLNERRLEEAIRLMKTSNLGIVRIAYEAGFSDPKYMTKEFRKRFDCTPKQYREGKGIEVREKIADNDLILERILPDEEAYEYLKTYCL